jgi:hypothetical protein
MRTLIVEVRRIREDGWPLPRFRLAFLRPVRGVLDLKERYVPDLNRTTRVARLLDRASGAEIEETPPIIDVRLIYATGDEMVLIGLERKDQFGRLVDQAQTWRVTPVDLV